jgi:hypothetical protein
MSSVLRRFVRDHWFFALAFGALYLILLFPLILMREGFVLGDYGQQFYPWTFAYAQALKEGFLLLWTPLIGSGFALFAEGQSAMLYAPNLVLFKFLPFKIAYNLLFLSHFLMGGIFSYVFAKKRGMSCEGATLTAILFTFGSAYAGCFANIATMRALVWFPLSLLLTDLFIERRKIYIVSILALVIGQVWLSGYLQMAGYHVGFVILYYFVRTWRKWRSKDMVLFFLAFLASFSMALPQLWATFDFALSSTRTLHEKTLALWGSSPPWSLATLFMYPWNSFLSSGMYLSVGGLCFLWISPLWKKSAIWWGFAFFSYLMALGAFGPIYWILIQMPLFSFMRNPSKFLFFTAFFLSMLVGFSWDAFFLKIKEGSADVEKFFSRLASLAVILSAGVLAAWVVVHQGSGLLKVFGKWYVETFVLGKSFHRGSMETYLGKIDSILNAIKDQISFSQIFFWVPFAFLAVFVLSFLFFRIKKIDGRQLKAALFLLIFLDIAVYGLSGYGTGFKGNVASFPEISSYEKYPRDGKWLDTLETEKAVFPPNRNLLSGHAIAGAYSPLLNKDYYLAAHELGDLDDSFGRRSFSKEILASKKTLIDFLGIKYLLIRNFPKAPEGWKLLRSEEEFDIFENLKARAEFDFIPQEQEPVAKDDFFKIDILENEPHMAVIETNTSKKGLLTRNQVYDRGWKVKLDGKKAGLEKVNTAFQGVQIDQAGGHWVEFIYQPDWFMLGRWFLLLGFLTAIFGVCCGWKYGN